MKIIVSCSQKTWICCNLTHLIQFFIRCVTHCCSLFQAILAHLVKCIAGEVAVVRDVEAGEGGARRHLSRTISVTGSTAKDTIVAGRDGGRDYTEINSIPPLPLYSLMLADLDTSYKGGEEGVKGTKRADGEGAHKSTEDQYSDLFQVSRVKRALI